MKRGDNLNGSEWIITLVDTILHSSTLISKVVNNYHFYYYEYNAFLLRLQDLIIIIITFIINNTMPSC